MIIVANDLETNYDFCRKMSEKSSIKIVGDKSYIGNSSIQIVHKHQKKQDKSENVVEVFGFTRYLWNPEKQLLKLYNCPKDFSHQRLLQLRLSPNRLHSFYYKNTQA